MGYSIVLILKDGQEGPKFPLKQGACNIGRSTDCAIRVLRGKALPLHATLKVEAHQLYLINTKGADTELNGSPISTSSPILLADQDLLNIAGRSFRVMMLEDEAQDGAVAESAVAAVEPAAVEPAAAAAQEQQPRRRSSSKRQSKRQSKQQRASLGAGVLEVVEEVATEPALPVARPGLSADLRQAIEREGRSRASKPRPVLQALDNNINQELHSVADGLEQLGSQLVIPPVMGTQLRRELLAAAEARSSRAHAARPAPALQQELADKALAIQLRLQARLPAAILSPSIREGICKEAKQRASRKRVRKERKALVFSPVLLQKAGEMNEAQASKRPRYTMPSPMQKELRNRAARLNTVQEATEEDEVAAEAVHDQVVEEVSQQLFTDAESTPLPPESAAEATLLSRSRLPTPLRNDLAKGVQLRTRSKRRSSGKQTKKKLASPLQKEIAENAADVQSSGASKAAKAVLPSPIRREMVHSVRSRQQQQMERAGKRAKLGAELPAMAEQIRLTRQAKAPKANMASPMQREVAGSALSRRQRQSARADMHAKVAAELPAVAEEMQHTRMSKAPRATMISPMQREVTGRAMSRKKRQTARAQFRVKVSAELPAVAEEMQQSRKSKAPRAHMASPMQRELASSLKEISDRKEVRADRTMVLKAEVPDRAADIQTKRREKAPKAIFPSPLSRELASSLKEISDRKEVRADRATALKAEVPDRAADIQTKRREKAPKAIFPSPLSREVSGAAQEATARRQRHQQLREAINTQVPAASSSLQTRRELRERAKQPREALPSPVRRELEQFGQVKVARASHSAALRSEVEAKAAEMQQKHQAKAPKTVLASPVLREILAEVCGNNKIIPSIVHLQPFWIALGSWPHSNLSQDPTPIPSLSPFLVCVEPHPVSALPLPTPKKTKARSHTFYTCVLVVIDDTIFGSWFHCSDFPVCDGPSNQNSLVTAATSSRYAISILLHKCLDFLLEQFHRSQNIEELSRRGSTPSISLQLLLVLSSEKLGCPGHYNVSGAAQEATARRQRHQQLREAINTQVPAASSSLQTRRELRERAKQPRKALPSPVRRELEQFGQVKVARASHSAALRSEVAAKAAEMQQKHQAKAPKTVLASPVLREVSAKAAQVRSGLQRKAPKAVLPSPMRHEMSAKAAQVQSGLQRKAPKSVLPSPMRREVSAKAAQVRSGLQRKAPKAVLPSPMRREIGQSAEQMDHLKAGRTAQGLLLRAEVPAKAAEIAARRQGKVPRAALSVSVLQQVKLHQRAARPALVGQLQPAMQKEVILHARRANSRRRKQDPATRMQTPIRQELLQKAEAKALSRADSTRLEGLASMLETPALMRQATTFHAASPPAPLAEELELVPSPADKYDGLHDLLATPALMKLESTYLGVSPIQLTTLKEVDEKQEGQDEREENNSEKKAKGGRKRKQREVVPEEKAEVTADPEPVPQATGKRGVSMIDLTLDDSTDDNESPKATHTRARGGRPAEAARGRNLRGKKQKISAVEEEHEEGDEAPSIAKQTKRTAHRTRTAAEEPEPEATAPVAPRRAGRKKKQPEESVVLQEVEETTPEASKEKTAEEEPVLSTQGRRRGREKAAPEEELDLETDKENSSTANNKRRRRGGKADDLVKKEEAVEKEAVKKPAKARRGLSKQMEQNGGRVTRARLRDRA
eukprot:g64982.t1